MNSAVPCCIAPWARVTIEAQIARGLRTYDHACWAAREPFDEGLLRERIAALVERSLDELRAGRLIRIVGEAAR